MVTELEEVPMSIVGGLDIHRKQLTFDWVDEQNGKWERGRISPADREHLADWLTRFDPATAGPVAFAMEGCTGWRYIAEEMAKAGVIAHLAEPADTSTLRGRNARQDRQGRRETAARTLGHGSTARVLHPAGAGPRMAGAAGALPRSAHSAHRLGATHPGGLFPPGHHRTRAGRDRPR
jgi:hypothetical protein